MQIDAEQLINYTVQQRNQFGEQHKHFCICRERGKEGNKRRERGEEGEQLQQTAELVKIHVMH